MLKPTTKLTSPKSTFMWTSVENQAFETVKKALTNSVLLAFPDFTKSFDIYADASGKQRGGLIHLTKGQQNYTTMELELLSVVEILKEYRAMLLGFLVVVHTDHKTLIYPNENSLRVKRWKLLLSKYHLTGEYIHEKNNIGADAFSRMEFGQSSVADHGDMKLLVTDPVDCVIEGKHIQKYQQEDHYTQLIIKLVLYGTVNPDYRVENVMGARRLTFQKRVVISTALREQFVEWYHMILIHPGPKQQ
ncbi:LOW QUALITY PROTEIN: Pol Polyprotein [Phytophthora megakarya]|uniref:Pol Polyprotein n=1 Tax=Phytophthora megakarya TaxID=4795 RepID=A0A225VMG4_9STRA|nr:LOW QUALITY PROTEIN: Pol Polyprotein [Phytophthora megakarya]